MTAEFVTARVSTLSIDFSDYTDAQRAKYEGTHVYVGVHVPIEYVKHLTLSTDVEVGIEVPS